jgi:ABC-2 type transport system permease protein
VILGCSILLGVVFGSLSNAIGMLVRQREAIIGINTFFMLPLTFLSSAFMSPALMPSWMRHIASGNPLNWAVTAGREALTTSPDWGFILIRCGGLLALAVACVAVSVQTFRVYQKSV